MIELRPYQNDMLNGVRLALRTYKNVLLQSPTGSGKTVLAASMLSSCSHLGKRAWFTVPRIELVEQTIETFENMGIPHGVIAAGFRPNPYQQIQIASIDTLKHRLGKYQPPDLVVTDECHHSMAQGWVNVINSIPNARCVGLTATPERLDGKGLGAIYNEIVKGPSVRWLIEQGYLAKYRAFAPPAPDLAGVHTKMGDYARDELAASMDKPTITGDAVAQYLKYARGKRGIAFGVSVSHSQHIADSFKAAGIVAVHLDGKTPKADRAAAMRAFRSGQIQILTNCGLFAEGVDVPSLEAVLLLRPTQSLAMYLQMVGRVLRPSNGKENGLILDHAGLIAKHGLPDEEREWSLLGRKERQKSEGGDTVKMRQCPKCFACHEPAPKCPECGHVYPVVERQPEHVEGDLVEVDLEQVRLRRNIENRKCESLTSLIELGRQRKYKSPVFWAAHYHKARRGVNSTLGELIEYARSIGRDDPNQYAAYVISAIARRS